MKKLIVLALSAAFAATAFAGCTQKIADTDQFLEVYCISKGYGTAWLTEALEVFSQQDWVKEKYPSFDYSTEIDDLDVTAHNKLSYGENANTADLLFGVGIGGYGGEQRGQLLNITQSVYKSEVPGEGVTVEGKMLDWAEDASCYPKESGESNVYYAFPWSSGMNGIIYNATLLESLGQEVPLTTDEFIAVCDAVSNADTADYDSGYAIMSNNNDGYWAPVFNLWWAQYDGMTKYTDFYYGLSGEQQSPAIFASTGRLKSLEVLEQLFRPDKQPGDFGYDSNKETYRYVYPFASEAATNYRTVQTAFLNGDGIFHANGDWFDNEMKDVRESLQNNYTFRFMRTPVISSIVETLDAKIDDATLAKVVAEADAGEETSAYVGDKDYGRIKEARSMVAANEGLLAVIPKYATAQNVAVDFLRFMATDICQEIYMRNTCGATLPFTLSEEAVSLDAVTDIHESRLAIMQSAKLPVSPLPSESQFPYGLKSFYSFDLAVTRLENLFASGKKTAQQIYQGEIDYWANAGTKFDQIISSGN